MYMTPFTYVDQMSKLEILSVAEDNYRSDRISCEMNNFPMYNALPSDKVKISIDANSNAILHFHDPHTMLKILT